MNKKDKSKIANKTIAVIVTTMIQAVLLIALIHVYIYIFDDVRPNLNLGISLYYFQLYIFPISMLICNFITMFASKRSLILVFLFILVALLIYYWGSSIPIHPFRVSFVVAITLVLYTVGLFATSRIRDWIS